MGRFVTSSDVKIIQADWWESWEQVTIRKWSQGQRDTMNQQLLKITGIVTGDENLSQEEIERRIELSSAQVPVLTAGIEEWTFTEDGTEDGSPVPPSKRWIRRLDPRDARFIVDAINELNPTPERTEQEQTTF